MLVPSLALAIWIIGYPVADLTRMSVHAVNRFGRVGNFVGALNFSELLADPLFWASFWRTVVWTVCLTFGTILISIPVAFILNQDFAGRGLARLIVLLPWAVHHRYDRQAVPDDRLELGPAMAESRRRP